MNHDIKTLPLSELKAAPYNPRKISKEAMKALTASIKRFGLVQPIVLNKRTGFVVGGHQRIEAMKAAGHRDAPVVMVDLTSEEEKALNLALNSPTVSGSFTQELDTLLAEIRESLPHDFVDMRFDELWKPVNISAAGEDDVPDLPKTPISKLGDVWKMGDHMLLCGDSTNADHASKLSGGGNWMWTDPPYGVNYVGKTKDALTIQNDGAGNLGALLEASFVLADQRLINGSPIYIAHPAGALSMDFQTAVVKTGWHFHETLIWLKNTIVMGHSDYHYKHEPIIYGWKGTQHKWFGGRTQATILEFDRPARSSQHPTMKPVALIVRCIVNSSVKGSVGFDPFMGSGSTLIAAQQTERRCLGVELDPRYCDVIIERWEHFTGQKAKRK